MTIKNNFIILINWIKSFVISFFLLSLVAFTYSNIIWYLPIIVVSFILLFFFPSVYGKIIKSQFGFSLKNIGRNNPKTIIFISLFSFLCWWMFWIFWIDLNLNQVMWVSLNVPLIPINQFKVSQINLFNILYLFQNPSKVISFLIVYFKNGYWSIFGFKPKGFFLLFLWAIEILITYYSILGEIFIEPKK